MKIRDGRISLFYVRYVIYRKKRYLNVLFSCRVRGDWFQVPCKNGKLTVKWLGEEALKRYLKLRPPSFVPNRDEVVSDIRKTLG